jgi:Mrp family chromosome partitioning ATPase
MSPPKGSAAGLRAVESGHMTPGLRVERGEPKPSLDPRCVMLAQPRSAQARSFRLLRHQLLTHSDPRVIVVTSAHNGEGKTTCAINLALCIAEETLADVLLLEANPGRPSLAQAFGLGTLRGYVGEASGEGDRAPERQILAPHGSRLHVGSASACAQGNGGLDRLLLQVALRELRQVYDYIVVDTASVLESADADVACECADGVLIAARAAQSRRGPLRRAVEQLHPAVICGVVLLDA